VKPKKAADSLWGDCVVGVNSTMIPDGYY
jgi:hypothetical protein